MKTPFMKSVISVGLLCLISTLVSCTQNDHYLTAKTLPPLQVEAGLDRQAMGELFVVPEGDGRLVAGVMKEPLPPTLSINQSLTEPKLQTLQHYSWLVVPKEAAEIWSQLLMYFRSRQINLLQQDVQNANLQTDWIHVGDGENNVVVRYRIHLEPALQPNFTEVHLVNVQGSPHQAVSITRRWPQISANPVHANDMFKALAKALSTQNTTGDSFVANTISFPPKVNLTRVDGEPVLDLRSHYERVKHAITNSMEENDLVIFEANEAAGIIYFNKGRLSKKGGKKKSFFARFSRFLDRISSAKLTDQGWETTPSSSVDLATIMTNMPNEDDVNALFPNRVKADSIKSLSNLSGYLLVQRTLEKDYQRIYIRNPYGQRLEPVEAKDLLVSIKKQLF